MKVAYILTSSRGDFFLEQLLLSVYSLRQYNKNIEICVLTDSDTRASFDGTRNLSCVGVEPIVVDCPAGLTPKERSRFLEFEMRKIVRGNLLYIDSDTIITDSLDDIEGFPGHVLAVRDKHTKTITPPVAKLIKQTKLPYPGQFDYFNSGLIFSRDTTESLKFFEDWKNIWLEYKSNALYFDQPAFNYANIINGNIIQELDGTWNCQLFRNGVKYLAYAKMIHYYPVNDLKNPYILAHHSWLCKVRENNYTIPGEISEMLLAPKSLIFPTSRVITRDNLITTIDSSIFWYLSERLIRHKFLFKSINKLFSFMD